MNDIKKFVVLGSGNSGAGGVHDYLMSREDSFSPFNGYEFRLINDPDGLNDLYHSLYFKFNINKSALSILRFKYFVNRLLKSNYNKKNNLYGVELLKITDDFISDITNIKYNGSPQFFLDKLSVVKKSIFYLKRLLLKQKVRQINLLDMSIPVNENDFLVKSQIYINNLFAFSKNYNENKNIVINQGGSFWSPVSSTKYYGKNTYTVLVTRDPKGVFWSMKRRNSLSYPGHDLEIFTKWYKSIMDQINKDEFKEIIHIKYEDFFSNFITEKDKLCNQLGIEPNKLDNFDLEHTTKNLFKYKDNLTKDEINFINKELKDYIQC